MNKTIFLQLVVTLILTMISGQVFAGCLDNSLLKRIGEPVPSFTICKYGACDDVSYEQMCSNVFRTETIFSNNNIYYHHYCVNHAGFKNGWADFIKEDWGGRELTAEACWVFQGVPGSSQSSIRITDREFIDMSCTAHVVNQPKDPDPNEDCRWLTSFGATEFEEKSTLSKYVALRPIRKLNGDR